jgi:hypothetical protein
MAGPMRHTRAAAAALVLTGLVVGLVAPMSGARGASLLWSLIASPLAATTGVQTVFTLTATNEDPLAALDSSREIGCVVVDVPGNFTVASATVTGSNSGESWHVDSIQGNRVIVHTDSGGDRLELLGWVRFTITATPFNTGSLAWNARAYRQQDCTGSAALVGVPPVVLVTGPLVTPTPTPTPTPIPTPTPTPSPTPTPRPSPTPTPTPTPLPSLPLPLPSLPLPSVPLPSAPSIDLSPDPEPEPAGPARPSAPRSTPAPTASVDASAQPGSDFGDGEVLLPSPGGSGGDGPGGIVLARLDAPSVAFDEPRLDLGALEIDLLAGIDVWSVPAATLGVPGILLLVWVALQAVGALAWIPAVKRLRGEDEPPGP